MANHSTGTNTWVGPLTLTALQNDWQATDAELIYLQELVSLRSKKRKAQLPKEAGYVSPTMVIDGFLYHGELKHANDKQLLADLSIRHIINVSDCELNQEIHDGFNVVWINLDDDFTADISQHFDRTNALLESCRAKGERVLVHCQMGISRSSSIVLAYLLK